MKAIGKLWFSTMVLLISFLLASCTISRDTSAISATTLTEAPQIVTTNTINNNTREKKASVNVVPPPETLSVPYIGMKEADIQRTKLGVAALTYESGGFWGGEEHTYHHYTFYYHYSTHTDVVFSLRTHNGVVDQIDDYRNSPIHVSDERHKTIVASGTPVNNK